MKKLLIIALIAVISFSFAEFDQLTAQPKTPAVILNDVKEVFKTGKVDQISDYFSGKTFLSLKDSKNGYYSKNQTINILRKFFEINHPVSFVYTSLNDKAAAPFATGKLKFALQGVIKESYVFVSLNYSNEKWYVSQITIN